LKLATGNSKLLLKGLFFDLCGTLLVYGDMDTAWEEWLETGYSFFKKSGLKLIHEEFQEACDGIFNKSEPSPENDGLTVYERRIKRLCLEVGHSMSVSQIQATATATISAWDNHMYLDPDCLPVLDALKRNKKLALITNFDHPPYIELALQKHGLKTYFSEVIISSLVGLNKPDPEIFQLALRKTGFKASDVVHVGDSLEDDVKGAKSAGIRAVFIQRSPGSGAPTTDYQNQAGGNKVILDNMVGPNITTIRRLSELLEML
jgi:putative hydrolase of the HAD superfamily